MGGIQPGPSVNLRQKQDTRESMFRCFGCLH